MTLVGGAEVDDKKRYGQYLLGRSLRQHWIRVVLLHPASPFALPAEEDRLKAGGEAGEGKMMRAQCDLDSYLS